MKYSKEEDDMKYIFIILTALILIGVFILFTIPCLINLFYQIKNFVEGL